MASYMRYGDLISFYYRDTKRNTEPGSEHWSRQFVSFSGFLSGIG
jgi:hypothetical protein